MVRVVLDTNILISACWKAESLEARVTAMVERGELTAFVSAAVLAEYREVIYRAKFRSRRECLVALLNRLEERAVRVAPDAVVSAATEEDDNRLLECAGAARAHFLVTGNGRHFPAQWETARVVNARQLLESL
jgi:uncharacterized protein